MNAAQNRLYVDLTKTAGPLPTEAALAEADGYLLSSTDIPDGLDTVGKDVLLQDVLSHDPFESKMAALASAHICRLGLGEIASMRDEFPDLVWIPRVDVIRQQTAFYFPTTHYSEGFRTYQPVFPTEGLYRVSDGDNPLNSWLERAGELGFETIWLHTPQAEAAGTGLDLDLRESVVENWSGNLWLSGGAQTIMHLKYLVQQGGLDALVIQPDLACTLGCDKIRASLRWRLDKPTRKPDAVARGAEALAKGLHQAG